MNAQTIAVSVLTLIAGVGIFLIACSMMSSNLESIGSKRLKSLFAKTSKSKLIGVGVGVVTTATIQSSSATTVMAIGFVNAGIMTLAQAATVIFGANIGTTVTGQLVALGMFGDNAISSSVVFATFAGIGAFILAFAKKDKVQKIGGVLAGFGMIFVGISLMSGAMNVFAESPAVREFLAMFRNPVLLVLIGAALTAVVQSSSVMTSMAITMVVSGLININQGIYITMGSNIGTCITALIAGLTSGRNAKRTALIHLIFNVSGVAIFLLIGLFMSLGGINYGFVFDKMFPHTPQMQLAMFHTIFNVATVMIVLPLTGLLVKLVTKLVPEKKCAPNDDPHFSFIDEHMLKMPPIAVRQTKDEVIGMAKTAIRNFDRACEILCSLDYTDIQRFRSNEKSLDYLNKSITDFVVKLLKSELDEKDRIYLSTVIKTVIDLERIGDYAENIIEYADRLKESNAALSADAAAEIKSLRIIIDNLYDKTLRAYSSADAAALAEAYEIEEKVDAVTADMERNHIRRLANGDCSADVGTLYLSATSNAERVADHLINMAKTIRTSV